MSRYGEHSNMHARLMIKTGHPEQWRGHTLRPIEPTNWLIGKLTVKDINTHPIKLNGRVTKD